MFRYKSVGCGSNNCYKNSPKSLWFGEIGTLEVDCHYNPLEVNSGYTGSIWERIKPLSSLWYTTNIRYTCLCIQNYFSSEDIELIKAPKIPQDSWNYTASKDRLNSKYSSFVNYLNNPYKSKRSCSSSRALYRFRFKYLNLKSNNLGSKGFNILQV